MAHHSRWATLTAFAVGAAMLVSPALTAVAAPSSASKSAKSSVLSSVANDEKLADSAAEADGKATVFINISGTSAAQKVDQLLGDDQQTASDAAQQKAAVAGEKSAEQVQSNADQVFAALKKLDPTAQKVYTASYSIPGVAVRASVSALNKLVADNPKALSVQKIHYQVPLKLASSEQKAKTTADVTKSEAKPANVNSDELVGNLREWKQTGKTGKGVNVAIIDTGLDYTHKDFGGTGTELAYQQALKKTDAPLEDEEISNDLDPAKFKGGYDFAGANYGSKVNGVVDRTAEPDANPIDGPGGHHGTHVAGTSLGYGVTKGGQSMKRTAKRYSKLTAKQLRNAMIAPGSAPLAGVYALKVFGDNGGSTGLVGEALDWVMQHNNEVKAKGDSGEKDLIKVVSMSLGGAYGDADEPENRMVDELSSSGVLSVVAAGNDGDITDITGEPSTASTALTVAASNSGKTKQDAIRVNAPAGAAGQAAGQYSENITKDFSVTGKVVALSDKDNLEGCKAYSDADKAAVNGNIVWISWDDNHVTCGSGQRFNMAEQAGAKAVLFASQSDIPEAGIGGNTDIPGFQLSKSSNTEALQAALKAGTLNVTLDSSLKHAKNVNYSGELQDTVANFTSRGSHGSLDGTTKPDVSAPGVGIISASAGTGKKFEVMSGTSMATPLTSGVAALVAQAHPDYNPAQLKAQIVNTATHDIRQQGKSTLESPLRVGTGRIDTPNAVTNEVLVASKDNPSAVTGQFGVVLVPQEGYKATKTFTVTNNSDHVANYYNIHYAARTTTPGVTYSVDKSTLSVPAHGTAEFSVTLSIPDQSALRHTKDTTQSARVAGLKRSYVTDASGVVELEPVIQNQAGATSPLRVSVSSAPKPVAQTSHDAVLNDDKKSGAVTVSGHGVNQGSGDEAYASKFGVFTLSGTDPAGDYFAYYEGESGEKASKYAGTRSLEGMDLTRVGYASTAPQLKAAGKDPSKGYMAFAIQTAKPWSRIGNANIIEILYAVGNQGYLTQITGDNGNSQAPADTAWVETYTYDFTTHKTGDLVDSEPVDDSTISDSNVIIARVKLSAFGLTAESSEDDAEFAFRVRSYTPASNGYYTDATSTFEGNLLKPGVWAEPQAAPAAQAAAADAESNKLDAVSDGDASSDPANAEGGQLLFDDQDGQKVTFHIEDKDAVPMAVPLSQHLDADQSPDQFDLSGLRTAVDQVKDLQQDDYTADSWETFSDFLAVAEDLLQNPNQSLDLKDSDGNKVTYSGQQLVDLIAQRLLLVRDRLVNISALKKAVDDADKLQEKDYTAGTWAPFAAALKAAKDVLANGSATQAQVDKALSDLQAAEAALISLRGLNAAINEADKLQQSDYQPAAWNQFADALAAAKKVQADPDATAKQIEDALVALLDAQAKLNEAKATDFAVLSALVDAATQGDAAPQQSDFTAGSWDAFAQALVKAQQDLATKDGDQPASQAQVDADVQALEAARNALVKVSALKNAVDAADDLNQNSYTSGSFAKFEEAKKAADKVLADPNASKDDVKKALEDLVAAQKALVSLTDLQNALLDASALNRSDYTSDSLKALDDAVAAGKAVLADPDATADQVDAAAKAVRDAITALVKAPAKDHSGSGDSGHQGGTGDQGGQSGNKGGQSGNQSGAGQAGQAGKPGQKGSGSAAGSLTLVPGKGAKGAAVSGKSLSQTGSNVVLAVVLATLALSAGASVLAVRRHRDEAAAQEPADK